MEPFRKKYGTLSVWENEDFLRKFTKEFPHSKAMEDMKPCLDGSAKYASWKIQGKEIPPTWEVGLIKLQKSNNPPAIHPFVREVKSGEIYW
jgi:hypothetical protein